MNTQILEKANYLEKQIKELRYFIDSIERIGNCSSLVFKREPRFYAKRVALPWSDSKEYEMDKVLEKRMLSVLRERLSELKEELNIL